MRSAFRWLRHHPDAWVPFAALGGGYAIVRALIRTAPGRLMLDWPSGTVWPSIAAALIWGIFATLFLFLWREHAGKRVARYWHSHVEPHISKAEREAADAASIATHRIVADIYEVVNGGEGHPDAPELPPGT